MILTKEKRPRALRDFPWLASIRTRWTGAEEVVTPPMADWPGGSSYSPDIGVYVHYQFGDVEDTIPVPDAGYDLNFSVSRAIANHENWGDGSNLKCRDIMVLHIVIVTGTRLAIYRRKNVFASVFWPFPSW